MLLLSLKPIPHFRIISVRRASQLPCKYLLVKEKQSFCSLKVSKFLHVALFANAKKFDVSEFQIKIGQFGDSDIKNRSSNFFKK